MLARARTAAAPARRASPSSPLRLAAPTRNRASAVVTLASSASSPPSSSSAPNPVRQVIGGIVSTVYKMSAQGKEVDPRLASSPLWQAIEKLDDAAVAAALKAGASPDEPSPLTGETPLIRIVKTGGHYKYPPAGIPTLLIKGGADLEKRDAETGHTAFELSLLKGWQLHGYALLDAGASTSGVAAIKSRLTCPDCKRLVAEKGL
jgi:hypothetical protein